MMNPSPHPDDIRQALEPLRQLHPDAQEWISCELERGSKREARTQQIFVHPEFPFTENIVPKEKYPPERYGNLAEYMWWYRELIHEQLNKSQHTTVLTYGGEHKLIDDRFMRECALRYPREISFRSHVLTDQTSKHAIQVNGMVDYGTLKKIIERWGGLHQDDSYLIHGADFADCVTDFAHQLAALKLWQIFLPPSLEEEAKATTRNALRADRKIQETRIRLGIVFDARNTYDFLVNRGQTDELQMLLIGEESQIIPSRDRKA
ncbi:hypothetical protein FJZ28_02045 [Candidatus Peregrinibacteria bacterium]|nr:hypothetical protein [Candidatus Peregrinibacteria bacterium]